jgi:hypothetical protein
MANDAGQIVGYFQDASGNHGFVEITVPNPPPSAGATADMILRGADTSPGFFVSPFAGQYLGRLRLRGPRGAQFEFTLAAIAQNLRRLAKLVARPRPLAAACVA